ncbi:MAG: hypothetical protein WDO24_18390 [Pseudomonadota bacterium]
MLGDRSAAFDLVNAKLADLDTRAAEAVATLYAVWNDALIDRESCDEARLIRGFLDEWHPEKREKFREAELRTWLGMDAAQWSCASKSRAQDSNWKAVPMSSPTVGRSLELYYIDGRPDGMLTAEMFNWTGHVLMAPRTQLAEALARAEAGYAGVYLLLGEAGW